MSRLIVATWLSLTFAVGCVGARPHVRMEHAKVPVSMTSYLLDADGTIIGPERQAMVGEVVVSQTKFAMFYSHAQLGKLDISDEINAAVEKNGGDAVVNLAVRTARKGCSMLHLIQYTQILPVFVGCVSATIRGQVVRILDAGTPAS